MTEFSKPYGEWLDEPQEVTRLGVDIDPESKKARLVEKKEIKYIQTMYTKAEPKPFSCADGKHQWKLIDRHSYTVKCQHCPIYKRFNIAFEFLDPDGHLRSRDTNAIIA